MHTVCGYLLWTSDCLWTCVALEHPIADPGGE